ncbi:acyl-CoA dehydrogenase [Xenophilus arseniciresistens]|uniref:Acyl-CoA dehydrogenase n=1 Tax=Xenophilus arseniciresistens TaxID=1283306 RepID=A0AAE3T078_9BURK|nr:acyl-CoA dehydrogenase [Xenophilus arseniciresistens]MDA7416032.1 acyl-CoA dehydrogenase [Xenophilus arseniciresistens]
MNFEHTHERRLLADSISRYAADRYGELTRRLVPQPRQHFDPRHWSALAELGALGALFTPEQGGFGGDAFDLMVVFEAIGRGLITEPFLASLMAGRTLAHVADPGHATLLAGIVEGTTLASLAHCESGGQWHPAHAGCTAHRQGDHWVLEGDKVGVPWGAEADILLISARTSGNFDDEDGLSLFAVPATSPGLTRWGHPDFDGGRSADMSLRGLTLPPQALVGAVGRAAGALKAGIACGIQAVCAEALGLMDVMMADTLEYLQTRKQFGAPIGSFQAVQHRMVDLMLQVEQARSATLNCARHMQADASTRDRCVAAAKFTISTAALKMAQECIQLHGGIGMTWELPLAHYAKRLGLLSFQLGDEDFHLARYASAYATDGVAAASEAGI